jgi:transcriptional regulator with XRE-family HTH domain
MPTKLSKTRREQGKPRKRTRAPLVRRERPTPEVLQQRKDGEGHTIADRLRELKGNLTLDEFAAKIGAPKHTTICPWLNGSGLPSLEYLDSIANAFGITSDWLLGIKKAPKERKDYSVPDSFENRLANELAQRVSLRVAKSLPKVTAEALEVDARGFLEEAVGRESEGLVKWASWRLTMRKAGMVLWGLEDVLMPNAEELGLTHKNVQNALAQIGLALTEVPPVSQPFVRVKEVA